MKPSEIKTYKLSEVVDLIPGKRRKVVDNGDFLAFGAGFSPVGFSEASNCPAGTIRLTKKGTLGKTYWHEEPFWMEEAAYAIEPKKMINKRYLFHWLLMKESELVACGNGGKNPAIELSRLLKLSIEVPDLNYQEKAVSILERLSEDAAWWLATITKEKAFYQILSSVIREQAIGLLSDEEKNED